MKDDLLYEHINEEEDNLVELEAFMRKGSEITIKTWGDEITVTFEQLEKIYKQAKLRIEANGK